METSLYGGVGMSLPDAVSYLNPPIAANGRIVVATCGTCGPPPGQSEFPPPPPTDGQLVFVY